MKYRKIFTKIKMFIRYFFSLKSFAKKFSSSSCESVLGVENFIAFLANLRIPLLLLECFDLYHQDII